MGRPFKDGIDYFPIDLDIMNEDSVAYVDAKYGVQAFGILVRLLIRIYRNGYYIPWSEKEQYLFARDVNVDVSLIREIVSAYINEGFFNINLYKCYGIITSRGLQKRYIKACERRAKIILVREFFLLDMVKDATKDLKLEKVTLTPLNATLTQVNAPLSTSRETDSQQKLGLMSTLSTQIEKEKEIETESEKETTPLPPPAEKSGEEKKEPTVFEVVVRQLGKICTVNGQREADMIGDWIESMPRDWIEHAILVAKDKGGRTVGYVDAILQAWITKYNYDAKPWEVESSGRSGKGGLSGGNRSDPTAADYERDRSSPGW